MVLLSFKSKDAIAQHREAGSSNYTIEKNFLNHISNLQSKKAEYYLNEVSKCTNVITLARRNSNMLSKKEQYVVKELSRDLVEYYNILSSMGNYKKNGGANINPEELPKEINKCFFLVRELDSISQENNKEDSSMKIKGNPISKRETEKYYKTFHRCIANISVIATLIDKNNIDDQKLQRIDVLGGVLNDVMNILNKNISKEFYNKIKQESKIYLKQTAHDIQSKEVDRKDLLESMGQNVDSCITKLDSFMEKYFKNNDNKLISPHKVIKTETRVVSYRKDLKLNINNYDTVFYFSKFSKCANITSTARNIYSSNKKYTINNEGLRELTQYLKKVFDMLSLLQDHLNYNKQKELRVKAINEINSEIAYMDNMSNEQQDFEFIKRYRNNFHSCKQSLYEFENKYIKKENTSENYIK